MMMMEPDERPPPNANANCVGPTSAAAGTSSACDGCPNQKECATGKFRKSEGPSDEELAIASRLANANGSCSCCRERRRGEIDDGTSDGERTLESKEKCAVWVARYRYLRTVGTDDDEKEGADVHKSKQRVATGVP